LNSGDGPADKARGLSQDMPKLRETGEPVLIVDDDQDWCVECAFSLRRLGYEPLVANSSSDAMAMFLENDVSIAVIDYNLPEGDGISLIHALTRKAAEQGRTLSFIMATGHATKDVAIGALRASVTDILEKPVTQQQLRAAMQRIRGLRPTVPVRDALLDKITDLSAELQRIALLMDGPDRPAEAVPVVEVGQPAQDVDAGQLKAVIREQLRREAKRREIGGGELFGDPTWAMLLDLLLAKIDNRRISVSSACIASGAPMSTALRLVRRLVGEEVLCRLPDEHDKRRHFLVINPKFERPLLEHIVEQARKNET
jgi:FixJ family two-component response regulator